ncbi:MAG TPA: hypothetical protein VFU21_22045 [Kofleriaceae bacterium]|nr:hypothetical protein [Kofleriaceae bacterium]
MRVAAAITLVLAAGCLDSPPDATSPDAAGPPICPFEDGFDEIDPDLWDVSPDSGGVIDVAGGRLYLAASPQSGDEFTYLQVASAGEWELSGLTVTADLEVFWSGNGNGDAALVMSRATESVGIIADSGFITGIAGDVYVCSPETCDRTYSPADHRYWRIREAAGELNLEASDGGGVWIAVAPPQPTPPGEHVLLFWSECGEQNLTTLFVQNVSVECD